MLNGVGDYMARNDILIKLLFVVHMHMRQKDENYVYDARRIA